jgi:hypothetical protein
MNFLKFQITNPMNKHNLRGRLVFIDAQMHIDYLSQGPNIATLFRP